MLMIYCSVSIKRAAAGAWSAVEGFWSSVDISNDMGSSVRWLAAKKHKNQPGRDLIWVTEIFSLSSAQAPSQHNKIIH
jgi:hypothetical protein